MSKLSAIERMSELLDQRDQEISELNEKIEQLEWWADKANYFRPRHERNYQELPAPRLQIELTILNEWHHEWQYGLVYQHSTDPAGTVTIIPMGQTIDQGSHRYDRYDSPEGVTGALPHRDGFYIRRDMVTLNLPAYAIVPGYPPVKLKPIEKAD